MYTTYVLQDDSGKLYKGVTGDMNRRLKEHKTGKVRTTSLMKNIKVAYMEEYDTFIEARILLVVEPPPLTSLALK